MSDMPDLSSLFGILNEKGIDINSLMKNFSNINSFNSSSSNNNTNLNEVPNKNDFINNSSNTSNQQTDGNFQMPDMENILKIMKIMNSMNSNTPNPSTTLLYSLKPFLRDSKKEKIDQYVNILKMSSIISEIQKSGGDFK